MVEAGPQPGKGPAVSDGSKIEWTQATWNCVTGCEEVSEGCDKCYAKTFAERWRGIPGHHFERGFDVTLRPDEFIACAFTVMAKARQHTFQLLTKRHARMRSLLNSDGFRLKCHAAALARDWDLEGIPWPLPNVHLGVSAESQPWWDIRWPALAETPAAVRFVSAEPLLGPVGMGLAPGRPFPDWLVIGGESGSGARPMAVEWVRDMLAQCRRPGVQTVPFVKQLGSVLGRELGAGPKGGDWDEWPEDLRVREFPRFAEAVAA